MSITPLTFTGVSTYSTDLQTVLTRAVNIASLPLKRLQNADSDVLQKKQVLSSATSAIEGLGSAVAALGGIAARNAVAASSSDSSKVSVQNTGATAPASYSITNITSIARAASETSIASLPDSDTTPVSANGSMRLVVGASHYDFTLTRNNLAAVRDQINGLGAGVNASILTTEHGNYLSLSASSTGAQALRLIDDPLGANRNLVTSANQGADAVFSLNGISIRRASNTVNDVVGGLTFQLLGTTTGSETVNLTLATDRQQLANAIQTFANNYNAVLGKVNQQIGPNAGLLSGDLLVRQMRGDLTALTTYQDSGTVQSLADVGVTFDAAGKINFDASKFASLSETQVSGAFHFFGSATTGFGALASKFTQLSDPVSGLIKAQLDGYDATDKRLQDNIATLTERINAMQKGISIKLQTADALLARLQSQQNTITASIQSLNFSLYGKQNN